MAVLVAPLRWGLNPAEQAATIEIRLKDCRVEGRRGYLGTSEGSGLGMIGALWRGCVSAMVPASVRGTGAAEYSKRTHRGTYLSMQRGRTCVLEMGSLPARELAPT